jgi:hypothetical protein
VYPQGYAYHRLGTTGVDDYQCLRGYAASIFKVEVDKSTKVADYVKERVKQSRRTEWVIKAMNKGRKIDGAASSFSRVRGNGSYNQTK